MWLKTWIKSFFPTSSYQSLNTIEIKKDHIIHNFYELQKIKPHHTIIPVVKSNAYGHGLKQISTILNSMPNKNLPLIAVDSYPEYQIVTDITDKTVLVLWETLASNYHLYNPKRTHIAVGSIEVLQSLITTKKKRNIHLFLNTGMNREWFQSSWLQEALKLLSGQHHISVVGVMSHLANADIINNDFTHTQISHFKQGLDYIRNHWHNPIYIHIANSAGISKVNDPIFTASRSGLSLYGYSPLEQEDNYHKTYYNLKPALRVLSTITALQSLNKNESVSYGLKRSSSQETISAALPFWYYEWLPRSSGSGFHVYAKDQALPIIGTVCMNLSLIDTLNTASQIGDMIEIIGWDTNKDNTIQQLAKINQTIPYTILTGLERSLKRIII